jgi:hypothetical protein
MTERRYGLTPLTLEQIEFGFDSAFAARDLAAHIRELQARILELEASQRTMRGVSHDFGIAGMDDRGPYQIGADGCRHDADCNYVCHVAAETIRGLEGAIEDWKAHAAKLEAELALARRVTELEADDANSLRTLLGADDGINETKGV